MRGWLVTGTDTEVGKTVATAALAAALRARGHRVRALKSLATGGPEPGEDATLLGLAAQHEPSVYACFHEPAAPLRAARQQGLQVNGDDLVRWIRAQASPGFTLVEGVGGWRVPLAPGLSVRELAQALDLPVLVVAANRLGVLNHSLLTVESIQAAGCRVAGLILNRIQQPQSPLMAWNAEDLREQLGPDLPLLQLDPVQLPEGLAAAGTAWLGPLGVGS